MGTVLLVLFYFFFPVLVLYLDKKFHIVNKIGPVVICYGIGLLIGNIGIFPEDFEKTQETLFSVVVPLAIPLLLFSLDVKAWFRMAGKTFLSLVLGLISVLVTVIPGYFIFGGGIPESWKVGGMLIGVYSGATANMAAIKVALDVDTDIFLLTHIYDLVVGAVTLLFLITIAQRTFLLFMRAYRPSDNESREADRRSYFEQYESYREIFTRRIFLPLLAALSISILIAGIGAALYFNLPEEYNMTVLILVITTLGILASFIKSINRIEKTFQAGMYLILIFCLVVASIADFSLFTMDSWPLLMWIVLAVIGSLFIHGILSRIFNVDVDNFLIISTALSMSPPFVPVVASALRNKDIVLPGLIIGILGYAMGNYLGVFVAYLLRAIG
ncbi:MAG: hypothetical protein AMS26_17380 [Bacteroides sp. SM23_62]|nr:MAG: hypothetical protein AMS26_17380 [Bacteroides sp. SM23_62]